MTALPVRPVDPRIKILGFRPVCWLRSMFCTPLTDSCLLDSTSPGWVHPFRGRTTPPHLPGPPATPECPAKPGWRPQSGATPGSAGFPAPANPQARRSDPLLPLLLVNRPHALQRPLGDLVLAGEPDALVLLGIV